MHLEFLVEGQSDRTALEPIVKNVLGFYGGSHTWRIHKHQGLGELPQDPNAKPDGWNRTLLHNLPASLRAYGSSLAHNDAVVVLIDLDSKNCRILKNCLSKILKECNPSPKCLIRIAIEELEAWYLGDQDAILSAYPGARKAILQSYAQDSICGTWEILADAVFSGGSRALMATGRQMCLAQKRIWARDIAPLMDVERNTSKSFQVFRDGLRRLVGIS